MNQQKSLASEPPKAPQLYVRNQYVAVFASIYLGQNYKIDLDSNNRVSFVFSSELSYRDINRLFRSNDPLCKAIRDALETNHSMGQAKKHFIETH